MNATIIQPDLKGFSLVALTPEPLRNNVAIPFSSVYKVFSFLPSFLIFFLMSLFPSSLLPCLFPSLRPSCPMLGTPVHR